MSCTSMHNSFKLPSENNTLTDFVSVVFEVHSIYLAPSEYVYDPNRVSVITCRLLVLQAHAKVYFMHMFAQKEDWGMFVTGMSMCVAHVCGLLTHRRCWCRQRRKERMKLNRVKVKRQ